MPRETGPLELNRDRQMAAVVGKAGADARFIVIIDHQIERPNFALPDFVYAACTGHERHLPADLADQLTLATLRAAERVASPARGWEVLRAIAADRWLRRIEHPLSARLEMEHAMAAEPEVHFLPSLVGLDHGIHDGARGSRARRRWQADHRRDQNCNADGSCGLH